MKRRCWPALALTLPLLGGCLTMPYRPAPNEPMASMRFLGLGEPMLCKDGQSYQLSRVAEPDLYKVPAGQRIAIGAKVVVDNYTVIYTCNAWLGFVPEADRSYVANAGMIRTGGCFTELVREDATKDTGVSLEPSVRPASCGVSPAAAPASAPAAAAPAASAPVTK